MDNASKAILMAGGVMIAIAIISVAVYAYTNAKGFASNSEAMLSASQIQSFNRFYTAYGEIGRSTTIKCIEGINILNRAVEDEIPVLVRSSKISSILDARTGKNIYVVADDDTKKYIETVEYEYALDLQGRVSGVLISD